VNAPLATYLFHEALYTFNTPVVVVLPKSWESYSEEEQKLLDKILTSVKVDIDAVQIIVQPALTLSALHIYSPARVLIFGAHTTDDIGLYQSTATHGFIVIRADDLSLLDDQKKKNLWVALRQMFGL
jgi:hypothetical protein